ncbi:MAG: nitronate monooxygenase, partial [Kofleriaceae bacterium]|nr:nitronate monooxygenase [Kofleriaceae bacterium]
MSSIAVPGRPWIIGLSPLERPDAALVAALCDAGALGVVDLGRDRDAAAHALAVLTRRLPGGFGVRIPDGVAFAADELPAQVDVVIVGAGADVAAYRPRTVLVQVTSLAEARAAVAAGADGLIAKGAEAGGRIGDETTFVLLQQLIAALDLPIWAQGGIGVHTAAACVAGGAAGVVLDSQLALLRESSLGAEIRGAIGAMDGSETVVLAGHRVYTRPDLPVATMTAAATSADDVRARLGGDDLARCLLPVGQEGGFARAFALRAPTARALIRVLGEELSAHLAAAEARPPLAP